MTNELIRPLAVITGASSGIGAEFARQFAARGYDLLLIARREDRLRALAEQIATTHRVSADILVADLAADDGRARIAARIAAAQNLAVLVNNAGFGTQGSFTDADLASQDQMHRLHILATLDLTHAALGNFKRAEHSDEGGRSRGIINVSSVAGFAQAPFSVSYGATKAWINNFTNGLFMELAAEGSPVRVQALCPGFTYSEFHDVLAMDRRTIPKMFWMTAPFVVSESLRGFDRGSLYVIPGWHYRWLVRFLHILPGSWMRWGSVRFARKRRARAQAFSRRG